MSILDDFAEFHLFLDATELISGRIYKLEKQPRAKLYTTELAVAEYVHRTIREAEKFKLDAKRLRSCIDPGFDALLAQILSEEVTFERVQQATIRKLNLIGISVVPVNADLKELLFMSLRRQLPFRGDKDKGFQDAVTLLTCLHYGSSQRLKHCIFVSNNAADFTQEMISKIAKEKNLSGNWWYARETGAAMKLVKDPGFSIAATQYMNEHVAELTDWLRSYKDSLRDYMDCDAGTKDRYRVIDVRVNFIGIAYLESPSHDLQFEASVAIEAEKLPGAREYDQNEVTRWMRGTVFRDL